MSESLNSSGYKAVFLMRIAAGRSEAVDRCIHSAKSLTALSLGQNRDTPSKNGLFRRLHRLTTAAAYSFELLGKSGLPTNGGIDEV